MATKTIKQRRADGAYDLILQLDYNQSITGNYSDVTWYLKLQSLVDRASYHYDYGNSFYLELNGQVLLNTPNLCSIVFDGKELKQLATGTIRVPHNADGSKSLPCKVTFQQTQNLNYANYLIEQSVELNQIPRATVPTLSSSSVKVGENVEVLINPASSTFTHTVAYKIGSALGTIKETNGRWLWTVPEELVEQFPNAATGTVVITCTTKSGSTTIGTATVKLTISLADDMKPTVTAITVEEAASLPEEIVGYVKGKSKLKITVEASGYAGSSISRYSISLNGKKYTKNEIVSDVLTQAGTNVISVSVTDSRSQISEVVTKEIEVEDYTTPNLTGISAYRCVAFEDSMEQNTGAYICVKFDRAVSEVGGSNQNVCVISYQKQGEDVWYEADKIIEGYAKEDDEAYFAADENCSYNVKIQLEDSFTSTEKNAVVGSAFTLLNIHSSGKGIGIGKVAVKESQVDSAWDIITERDIFATRSLPEAVSVHAKNSKHDIALHTSATGNAGLWDATYKKWLLYANTNGNLFVNGGIAGQKITATGENLNDYTIPGIYYFSSSYQPTNIPAGTTGVLVVVQYSGVVKQIWFNADTTNEDDYATYLRSYIEGTWKSWHRMMVMDEAPIYEGSSTNGCIKFPTTGIQICWQRRTFSNITIKNAWGNMYESGVLTFLNWCSNFSEVPVCQKMLIGSDLGVITQNYGAVTVNNPGSVYACRPNQLTTATTIYGYAVAVGKC